MSERLTFGESNSETDALLGELILYVADKCSGDSAFGAVKLNKILWVSDFRAYGQLGAPITGVVYSKRNRGPAPRRLVPVRQRLIDDNAAVVRQRRFGDFNQERIVPLRDSDLSKFTVPQILIVNSVIEELWGKSAQEVTNLSHGKAWEIPDVGESIPYEAIFLSDDPPGPADEKRAREVAEKYGLAS